jgi:hypothetical protein
MTQLKRWIAAMTKALAHRSVRWVLSQIGGFLVCLQVHSKARRSRSTFHSIGSMPLPSWEPSQNGWLCERPRLIANATAALA